MHRIPVGVLGASGYAGRELVGLLLGHPVLTLAFATAHSQQGETVRFGPRAVTFTAPEHADLSAVPLVFSSLPHGASVEWVRRARTAGAKVVDLSHDLRPGHATLPEAPSPYGLTEFNREAVRAATVVANPGCYPTSILVPLQPLVQHGLLAPGALVSVTSASGVTGAGLSPRTDLLFGELSEDFRAYGTANGHRHLVEMRATLAGWGADCDLLFTPHLLPVARGILSTLTIPLRAPLADPIGFYREAFAGEPFLEVADAPPTLHDVQRRNVVRVWAAMAAHVRHPVLQVVSALDNLVKGAAGQALQNANLMLGLDEPSGLPR
ncbi:MAG: N-acetyl-gamma-glutamyl-phosphate reductase [Gemmatimonadaceae bacterium]|jgi:N-acetyl-gamma-glutamyl-phosphate reductase|nr:N-acetyl-gamma-glutamyl-phosphate reductase [Gemmatimonadaceae bacterium]